jgi:hypothetical protein
MRFPLASILALALVACGQPEAPPPLPEPVQAAAPAPWFICDAVNTPVLLVFNPPASGVSEVVQYDKPNGALIQRTSYTLGEADGAAGSIYTPLLQNGAEAGHVRQINSGMLETPASAYTPAYTSVRIGERDIACRWMPRTRVFGFTGRRSFVVYENADGDLIYTTYDFATAAQAQPIELSDNARTTSFSVEVRDGEETTSAEGSVYTFDNDGFRYTVTLGRDQTGTLAVSRNGESMQEEPLIAFIQGDAGAE